MKKGPGKLTALGFASWLVNGCGKAVTLFEVLVVLERGANGKKRALPPPRKSRGLGR